MNIRKILIITIIVLLTTVVLLVIYNFLLKDDRPAPVSDVSEFIVSPDDSTLTNGSTNEPTVAAESLFNVDIRETQDFVVGQNIVFSVLENSYAAVFSSDGNFEHEQALSVLTNADSVVLSPSMEQLVLSIRNSLSLVAFSEDGSPIVESLSPQVTGADFSPIGILATVEESEGNSSVNIQNGGGSRTVFTSQIPDLEASWINNNTLLLTTRPSGTAVGIAYLLNVNTGAVSRLTGNKYGLTALVSPDQEWMIFSETESSGRQMITKAMEISSGQEKIIQNQIIPEKCVFSSTQSGVVYCATLKQNPRNFVMPDDYRKGVLENRTSDIIRIELETGSVLTVRGGLQLDPIKPKLSESEDGLFFINKTDGSFYRLSL